MVCWILKHFSHSSGSRSEEWGDPTWEPAVRVENVVDVVVEETGGGGGRPASGAERLIAGPGWVYLVLVVVLGGKITGPGGARSVEGIQTENAPEDASLDGP